MKKILLAAVVAACSLAANAQVWLGGSLGVSFNKTESTVNDATTKVNLNSFSISPVIGYELSEKWDLGLEARYGNAESKYEKSDNRSSSSIFLINPFARYKFANVGIATFFVDGGFEVGKTSTEQTSVSVNGLTTNHTESTTNNLNIGVRPGVKLALTKNLEAETHLGYIGYQRTKSDSNEEQVSKDFGMSVSSSDLYFGLIWKF